MAHHPQPPGGAETRSRAASSVPVDERVLTRQGLDRKAELLEVAERLFASKGAEQTRMIDIAREAGVAKGLVYWYFENKDALLLAVIRDVRDRLRVEQQAVIRPLEDPLAQVYVGTVATVRFVAEHARLYLVIANVSSDPKFSSAMAGSAKVHAVDTAAILAEGQRLGLVRDDETPEMLAHAGAGVVNNFVLAFARRQLGRDVDVVAHAAARYVVRAIAADSRHADAVVARWGSTTPES